MADISESELYQQSILSESEEEVYIKIYLVRHTRHFEVDGLSLHLFVCLVRYLLVVDL